MTILEWLDLIYAADVALFVGYVLSKALYLWVVRRRLALMPPPMGFWIQAIIVLDLALGVNEGLIVYLLAKSTGTSPSYDINQYRQYIAVLRGAMGAILFWAMMAHLLAVYVFLSPFNHRGQRWQIIKRLFFL